MKSQSASRYSSYPENGSSSHGGNQKGDQVQRKRICSTSTKGGNINKKQCTKKGTTDAIRRRSQEKELQQDSRGKAKLAEENEKCYVIFNGPMAGIYTEWHQVAIHIAGKKAIIHKSFRNKESAKKAIEEFNKASFRPRDIRRLTPNMSNMQSLGNKPNTDRIKSFRNKESAKKAIEEFNKDSFRPRGIQRLTPNIPNVQSLGKKLNTDRINAIPTTQMKQEMMKVCRRAFLHHFESLNRWTAEQKKFFYYPKARNTFGPKAIILPGAEPLTTYLFYACGLVETIYLENLHVIKDFPPGILRTVRQYKERFAKGREMYLQIYSSYPVFNDRDEIIVPKHSAIQIGISNRDYPTIDESPNMEVDDQLLRTVNINLLKRVFNTTQKIAEGSNFKINYRGPQTVVFSHHKVPITGKEAQSLLAFEQPFYNIEGSLSNLLEEDKRQLCRKLKEYTSHQCAYCHDKGSSSSEPALIEG